MAGPKQFHCGICSRAFDSRQNLNQHMIHHEEVQPVELTCSVCNWPFDDSLALEAHKIQTGHSDALYKCEHCRESFYTQGAYNNHRKFPNPCSDGMQVRKKTTPLKARDTTRHAASSFRGYHLSRTGSKFVGSASPSDTPSDVSDDKVYCHTCKKSFISEHLYDRHMLGCEASVPSAQARPMNGNSSSERSIGASNLHENITPIPQAPAAPIAAPSPAGSLNEASRPLSTPKSVHDADQRKDTSSMQLPPNISTPTTNQAPPVSPPSTGDQTVLPAASLSSPPASIVVSEFVCGISGCQRKYKAEPALKAHQQDAHGVGGEGLDLHGRDSWMHNQRIREQLKTQGLLRSSPRPRPSGGSLRGRGRARGNESSRPSPPPPRHATVSTVPAPSAPATVSIGGPAEIEQAKFISGKIMRLILQSDIVIHHDGRITVSGIAWTRIGVAKQADVVGMFDGLCHLPAALQGEYLPPPKTFKDEYLAHYPAADFQISPAPTTSSAAVGVVTISCSRVVLADGREEAVKIAAVDVITCRILMNYLICTDPRARVKDWRTDITGLRSFADIEAARQDGYKVLKGWQAARSALWKFVDKETIIVGYNVRHDLDALRMIHGRAVDVAKTVEKAAKGPLSKQQLSLESLCRDFPQVQLSIDPTFGRDALQNAMAARELGLWFIKNGEKLAESAKKKSLDYQRVTGVGA